MTLTAKQEQMNMIAQKYGLPIVFNSDDTINDYWCLDFRQMIDLNYFEQICIVRSYKR